MKAPGGEETFLGLYWDAAGRLPFRPEISRDLGASGGRGASKVQIAGNGVRTAAATRLSPVDWDMESNHGFILASDAWRGRDVVERTRFKSRNPAQGVFMLSNSGGSTRPRSLGGVAAVL